MEGFVHWMVKQIITKNMRSKTALKCQIWGKLNAFGEKICMGK